MRPFSDTCPKCGDSPRLKYAADSSKCDPDECAEDGEHLHAASSCGYSYSMACADGDDDAGAPLDDNGDGPELIGARQYR